MELAQKAYQKTPPKRKKMIAVYVNGTQVVIGQNQRNKTHTLAKKFGHYGATTHAELHVLNQIRNADGGKLYVYRETSKGIALAKPCKYCLKLIKEKNIRLIYYTTEDGIVMEKVC